MGAMMTKKQRQRIEHKPAFVAETLPTPKRYSPPQCPSPACTTPNDGENYTDVVSSPRTNEHITRYLKCRCCGNTWKAVERLT